MDHDAPPPLSRIDTVWKTYLRAFVFLLPPFAAWQFAYTFLFPRLQTIWGHAGLNGSKAEWLISFTETVMHSARLIIPGVIFGFLILEQYSAAWPRYRRKVIDLVILVFNACVLFELLALLTAALLAVPIIINPK